MSKCISSHGEYSDHEPSAADVYTCGLCGAYDDDRMHDDLTAQAATIQRVTDMLDYMRDDHDRAAISAALNTDRTPGG